MTKLLHFKKWYLPLLIVLFGGFVKTTNLHAQSTLPEGALNGLFSVSENTQVRFSQGNLQYKASTNTWRFAENQYDYLGDANFNISSSSSDYFDLFGWGTSGYNHGSVCYQPWSTSTSYSDYYAYGSSTYNLFDQTGKADWGYNAISNGGNQENSGWRTLTRAEWLYLFDTRSTPSGIRYAKAIVNNVDGVILLPDNWQRAYYSLSNTNSTSAKFTSNNITSAQWATLEQHGAVFLPAAGSRNGIFNSGLGYGYYWSASSWNNTVWIVEFSESDLYASMGHDRSVGRSVRLVYPSQYFFGINASPSPVEGGTVSGAGIYPEGAECSLIATASTGYHFVNWTENGTQVSTNSTYTFTVTGDRTLVANFANSSATSHEGALNGVFSVRDGYQVYFSQGNLQYKASTNTWRFAANQYDYIGDANSNISSTYSNYIDLFGWGTSGYNHGSVCYQPWSTSTSYSDYYAYGSLTYNLFDQTGKADWGYNAISNGGNQANRGWRTLTKEEWDYVFNTRITPSGIRYAKAKVNNVNGVILLPDDWQSSYYSLSSTNTSSASFSSNTITASQWATLEQHGAVFLPAAGRRSGTSIVLEGSSCNYWSSSCENSYYAWDVYIDNFTAAADASYHRYIGHSVRLVFPSQGYSFGINASPSPVEGGTVSGAGIYPEGAECSLIATASTGYHFVNWTENGTQVSTSATYTFRVTGDRTLVANFAPNTYTVTLNTNNGTINSGNVTSYTYGVGATLPTNVTRTGYTFGGWYANSGLTGTAVTSISTTATGDKTFWAKWTINSYTIGASANPTAGGTVNGAGSYNYGASCTLVATPATGYNFTKWTKNGTQVSTSASYTFTVNGAATYVAQFTKKTYTITATANPTAGGTITGTGTYEHGASCTLVATPATGYHFVNWTQNGPQVSTNASYQFTVTGARTLVANFAPNTYTVTLNTNDGTINSGNVTSYTYGEGATLPTDVTRTGYTFGGWYDNANLSGTAVTSISTTATGDKTFWAKWTINSYAIGASANPTEGGTVSGAGSYNYGASCTLVATPATGYNFTKWTKNNTQVSTSASYNFTVTEAADYVAVFTKKTYSIVATANPTAGGTITGAGTYEHGASCTLVATPSTGYHFVNWTQNGTQVSTNASYQFTVTGGKTLVANFAPNTYTVTLNTNNGTINSGNVTSYTYGVGATLPTDVTRTGYTFGGWYDNANLSGTAVTSISTTATGDKTFWAKWTINSYAIGASANPTVGGTVSGAGTYNYGASCTLVATPATGYNFTKWTKNNTQVSTSASYTFTVTEAADYVAVFTKKTYSIVATANPTAGGTITGAGTYEHGSSCTLVATPATGYSFVNWTSGNSQVSTNASYQFTVTGARTLVANFSPNTYTVTLNTNNGTINSGNVTSYTYGEGATLPTDVTRTGYTFGGWYDNANLSGAAVTSISTTATGDKTFWAKWTINSYAIGVSANPTAGGTVSGAGSYNYGASCTLVATPATGYNFTKWTKNGTQVSTSASYTFTVNGAATYVAQFTKKTYTITATANPTAGGTITGAGTYEHGSSCTLVATPATGYSFVNWTSGNSQVSTNVSYQFTVTGARTLVANFAPNTYTVTLNTNNGTINSGNVTSYTYGEGVTLPTDVTRTGYTFGGWYDNANLSGTAVTSISTTATGDKTFWAKWTINSYAIGASANPTEGGTVSGAGSYNYGASCTLTATPATGYSFVNWTENGTEVSTDATFQFTVTGARSLVAHFSLNSYNITATANPTAGGTVTGAGAYNHFESCTLTATASDGYTFENWTENGVEVTREMAYTFTVEGARTLVANFTLDIYAITAEASPAEGGTVAGEGFVDGEGDFAYGSTCTVTATANEGYTFVNWTKFGVEVATTATYTFTVEAPTALIANFSLNSYDIAASANPTEGGTITGAGTYTHGETVTLTATANEGYLFDGWVKDEETVSTEPSLSFTATEDGEYVAQFTLQSYPIEITAFPTEGGTVTGAGTYYHGDICTLTATPNTGYVFLYWIKDGVQVSTEASYTFTVTGPATYVANFVNFNYEVSVVVNPAEAGTVQGAGNYDLGLTCTLTATPNEGYQFVNWTVNGEEVSSDLEYSFTVTEPVAVEANFRIDAEFHEFSLTLGWNWWSTYIEMNGVNGLALLEDALGASGIQIKSQSSFVTYDEGWFGMLNGIVNEQSYRINMGEGGDYSLAGTIADPTAHPIAIGSGWNWIGYVENVEMDLNTAMANLDKSGDDIVKSRDYFSTYYAGYGWWGTLESLQPGGGYMYKASASGTLVYPEASKAEAIFHSPEAATWWNPDGGSYADNMSVMAVVEVNGEEVRSEEVELGAFSQGECRGAVRLLYVAPLDRYVAFLTVHGEDGDGLSFRLKNDEGVLFASDRVVFAKNAVLGSTAEPYVLRFGNTGVTDAAEPMVTAYPNPSTGVFQLEGEGMERVEVYTMLGELVRVEEVHADTHTLNLSGCAEGVYHLRVQTQNGLRHLSVVVAE